MKKRRKRKKKKNGKWKSEQQQPEHLVSRGCRRLSILEIEMRRHSPDTH